MKKKLLSLVTLMTVVLLLMPSLKAEAASITNPKVIIEQVDFKDSVITVKLANKSNSVAVTDVLVSYGAEKDVVVPVDGQSNQAFVSSIKASGVETVEFPVVIKTVGNTSAKVEFTIEYVVASNDAQKSNRSFIMLDLTSAGGNLTISNVSFPREGYLYEKGLVSFTYKNATDSDISDLKLIVSGLNDGNVETYSVGDVKAKKNGYYETYVSFNTLGNRDAVVAYSYTTADGEEVISEGTLYSTYVSEKITSSTDSIATVNPSDDSNEKSGLNVSFIFIAIAGVLVVICAILAINSTRKNK